MSQFDSKALASAREVMALTMQEHIGGDAQLLAKIQLLFIEAMEYAAPAWVGVDWAEGCKPDNSPVIPLGWKLVPIDPTAEMIAAAMDSDDVVFDAEDETAFCVCHDAIYTAMIAAAPKPEVK